MKVPQRCTVKGRVAGLKDVFEVEVPGIYGQKGQALPRRLARLIEPAARALDAAMVEISREGGHLYISDMFRTWEDQRKANLDYVTGRKRAYSPPPGGSMHEAARAIDLDPGDTGIGLKRTKEILARHGWIGIAAPGKSECWHHDWRGDDGQREYKKGGYRAMASYCIKQIGNTESIKQGKPDLKRTKWIQESLNRLMKSGLAVDGVFGNKTKAAVKAFQKEYGLVADGIVGPITEQQIKSLLK